ncbi:hypothetical protein [Streptomyces nigra]|uniref:hypothetical protein n=1 Tax=Streptomyces nigra TaxID=1827580 RepID=UPI00343A465D
MILKVERTDARTWPDEHLKELFSEGFPEFLTADRLVKEYIGSIRTHQRLGADILAPAPASQTMTGTVAEWEGWTGMAFPESGDYVIPDGLSLLRIDRQTDQGVYQEPNVWMRHC